MITDFLIKLSVAVLEFFRLSLMLFLIICAFLFTFVLPIAFAIYFSNEVYCFLYFITIPIAGIICLFIDNDY